jgi:hypothetical protein
MGGACSVNGVRPQNSSSIIDFLNSDTGNSQQPKIIFLGLDYSGKSILVESLIRERLYKSDAEPGKACTLPTPPNVESPFVTKFGTATMIEIPGTSQERNSWPMIYTFGGVIKVITVIDMNDPLRFPMFRTKLLELITIMEDLAKNIPLVLVTYGLQGQYDDPSSVDTSDSSVNCMPSVTQQDINSLIFAAKRLCPAIQISVENISSFADVSKFQECLSTT